MPPNTNTDTDLASGETGERTEWGPCTLHNRAPRVQRRVWGEKNLAAFDAFKRVGAKPACPRAPACDKIFTIVYTSDRGSFHHLANDDLMYEWGGGYGAGVGG